MTTYSIASTTIQDLIDNLYEVESMISVVNAKYKHSLHIIKNDKNDYKVEFKLWKNKN